MGRGALFDGEKANRFSASAINEMNRRPGSRPIQSTLSRKSCNALNQEITKRVGVVDRKHTRIAARIAGGEQTQG